MYILLALLGALSGSASAIFVKLGSRQIETLYVTALRIVVVFLFSWGIVFATGTYKHIANLTEGNWLYLLLSGISQTVSFRCYFKAVDVGEVSKVNPVDKLSTVITMIMGMTLLGEATTVFKITGMILILAGTIMMITRGDSRELFEEEKRNRRFWLVWALVGALFASFTSILAKKGLTGVDANLATAIRNTVTLIILWTTVFTLKLHKNHRPLTVRAWVFIIAAGLATGLSLLFFHQALQEGPASVVTPIDRLSIVISVLFSIIFLKERLNKTAYFGLAVLVVGTLVVLIGEL